MSAPPDSAGSANARRSGWVIAVLALVTGVLGACAVVAPVIADDPVVSWPRAGGQPVSTVLPLSPYRPLQFEATIPCATLRALDTRPAGGQALRTLPAEVGATPGEGLVVAAAQGIVTITASGVVLAREAVPPGNCDYLVRADAGGIRVSRDGAGIADRPDLLAPQVAELHTDAAGIDPARTRGLGVELHTDARYQSSPTPLKTGLLIAHGLALVVLLVLAWRWWRGAGPGLIRPRPSWADAVVVTAALAWVVLGPVNIDDSWYLLMARNAMDSGYIGNVIYQFNVTENPFATSQYAMQAWGALGELLFGDLGWSLAWIRLLPLGYGLVGYALLRVLVSTMLGRAAQRSAGCRALAPWALAGAYLLWWLAYGITLRPEPLIATGTAVVMVLAELARRRRSVGVLAAATAVAAFTVTLSPTGLVAFAPLMLCLPWLWQWWRVADPVSSIGAVLLAAAACSIVVPLGFADATLGDVLESTAVHRWYYRQHPWYEEYLHYANLLAGDDRGVWAKRLPVLLTLAVLLAVAIAAGRRTGNGGPSTRLLNTAALITTFGLVAMALTPTKWVNHFGAVAAPATVLLAAAVIRSPLPRRAGAPAIAIGVAGLVTATTISFAGPNLWRPFADWGQPFGNHVQISTPYELSLLAPSLGPLQLRSPLLWLAVAGLGWWWARRRGRPGPDRTVLIGATCLGVVLLLASFTYAPLRQYPAASVALMNLRALSGQPCGLASAVQILTDARPGLAAAVGDAELTGDMRQGRPPHLPPPPNAAPGTEVWHDDVPGGAGTGTLATPWYPLPGPIGDGKLIVPLAGALDVEQRISLQLRTGPAQAPEQVRTVRIGPFGPASGWIEAVVAPAAAGLVEPTAVRLIAEDRLTRPGSWLAVARPRLATPRPVTEVIAGRPVFADQVSAGLWPCEQQIALRDGLASAPAFRLRAADGIEGAIEGNSIFAPNGGTLVQIDRTSQFVELASELAPPGVPTLGWGHVEEVVYRHPVGLVDLRVERVHRNGWTRLPTLVGEPYTGRIYIG